MFTAILSKDHHETPYAFKRKPFQNPKLFQCQATIYQKNVIKDFKGNWKTLTWSMRWVAVTALPSHQREHKLPSKRPPPLQSWPWTQGWRTKKNGFSARHSVIILKWMWEFVYFQTGILKKWPHKEWKMAPLKQFAWAQLPVIRELISTPCTERYTAFQNKEGKRLGKIPISSS